MIALVPVVVVVVAVYALLFPKIYESSCTIAVDPEPPGVTGCWGPPYTSNIDLEFIDEKVREIQSAPFLGLVVKQAELQEKWGIGSAEATIKALSDRLKVERVHGTPLLKISVRSFSPDDAVQLANSIAECYREYCLDNLIAVERQKIDAIENKLKKQYARMDAQENEVITIRTELRLDLNSSEVPGGAKYEGLRAAQTKLDKERGKYNELLAQHRAEIVQLKVPLSQIEIIDVAEPNRRPVSPNLFMNVLLSVALAGMCAVAGGIMMAVGLRKPPPPVQGL